MDFWSIFVIAGLGFIILEMIVPTMFFLNLAIAGLVTALFALFIHNFAYLILIFVVLSILSVVFLRPFLIRHKMTNDKETGMEGKYIGKIVEVIEPINRFSGAITIYDERWDARCDTDEPIPTGSKVKIIKNESLVLTVERI